MEYVIKFRHKTNIVWKKRKIQGHKYLPEIDKIVLHYKCNKIEEIPEWSKHYVVLGSDFVLAQKEQMEKESGVDVKLKGV
jgi:hypothetical protein